jgi:tripartite-type tricarboxylate transporter receptor subunit TctC
LALANTMTLPRRRFLHLAASVAALPAAVRVAWAQTYPTRPVRWIVPFAPGGVPDIIARLLGQWLSERLGQPFVIENRPGAGSNAGTEAVARAAADGYTLLSVAAGSMISPSLYRNLNFDFLRDIGPVASVGRFPHAIAVHPALPVHSIPELIAYARDNPRKLNEGSLTGASVHLASELFKMASGANIVHVPYRSGATALADTVSGQLQVSFDIAGVLAEFVDTGKLRGLAVTTTDRWEGLPTIPAVSEFVPGFVASSAGGIGVPRHTPPEIIEKLTKEINAGLNNEKIRTRLTSLGATVLIGSPADFGKLIADEVERWGRAIRAAEIRPE